MLCDNPTGRRVHGDHMTSLQQRVVLITGAAGGFGQEMVRQFSQAGSRLIVTDRPGADVVAQTERLLDALDPPTGPEALLGGVEADLTTAEGAAAVYAAATALTPTVDMVVNNAGVAHFGPFHAVPPANWEALMQVNLLAPMRLTALFLPDMMARRAGHLVNIVSSAGLSPSPGLAAYSASKFGLRAFGASLAAELRPLGIAVTNCYPFFARTPILDSEQFGVRRRFTVPDSAMYDPAFVIRALLQGIREDAVHVLPGAIPKAIDVVERLAPSLTPVLARWLLAPGRRNPFH